jgi:hypothetical protein
VGRWVVHHPGSDILGDEKEEKLLAQSLVRHGVFQWPDDYPRLEEKAPSKKSVPIDLACTSIEIEYPVKNGAKSSYPRLLLACHRATFPKRPSREVLLHVFGGPIELDRRRPPSNMQIEKIY